MKFMKLGSKPDMLQTGSNDSRYMCGDFASDIIVDVGETRFFLHKFPLLSKCALFQKLAGMAEEENLSSINIPDIPGSVTAFETCVKFCYGITIVLNAYNLISIRCAAEYLGMHETIEKGNLIYKIDVFLKTSVLRSWRDSIIALQTTNSFLPLSEELKLVGLCVTAVASLASVETSMVSWSYGYSPRKLAGEDETKPRHVPRDWWVEDLCDLDPDLFELVMKMIKTRGSFSKAMIAEALNAYACRWLPGYSKDMIPCDENTAHHSVMGTIIRLLPVYRDGGSCKFLLKLLKAALLFADPVTDHLVKRIGPQLEGATVHDLVVISHGSGPMYDVDIVGRLVNEFLMQDQNCERGLSHASKLMVANLVDGYLVEIAKDPHLPLQKFVELAAMVPGDSRPTHDALYRAIDMFLKEHPAMSKGERKRMCNLMDCKKLSLEACMHAMQNERLPSRVLLQILFFEQIRSSAFMEGSTPSNGSHRSTINPHDEPDGLDDFKSLKDNFVSLRLNNGRRRSDVLASPDKNTGRKGGWFKNKVLSKIGSGWSGDNSGSDSTNPEESKSTSSGKRRNSVSL